MASTIIIAQQQVEISEVSNIVVTPVVDDPANNGSVRDIRIFGTVDGKEVLVLQARIRSPVADNLHLDSPASQF